MLHVELCSYNGAILWLEGRLETNEMGEVANQKASSKLTCTDADKGRDITTPGEVHTVVHS